jgi:LDH2 family malate/lactate/ureidoglycolate dehydrogenase
VASEDELRTQILSILRAWGLREEPAAVVADVMTDTDLAGVDSHGIAMLPAYGCVWWIRAPRTTS